MVTGTNLIQLQRILWLYSSLIMEGHGDPIERIGCEWGTAGFQGEYLRGRNSRANRYALACKNY